MTRLLIHGIGGMATGRIEAPERKAERLTIVDGVIESIDGDTAADLTLDARSGWVLPGLWDGRFRLYFGDHEPTFSTRGAIAQSVAFGVTTIVSAGAPRIHGWSRAPRADRELAILTARSWRFDRPRGIRVVTDVVTANPGWGPDDLAALRSTGARIIALEVGSDTRISETCTLVRAHGLEIGLVIPNGDTRLAADWIVEQVDPAFAIIETGEASAVAFAAALLAAGVRSLGVTLTAGPAALLRLVPQARALGRLDRVFLGTGLPSLPGAAPAGLALTIELLVAGGVVSAPEAVALGSGNVARALGLDGGTIDVGSVADLAIRAPGGATGWWSQPTTLTMIRGDVASQGGARPGVESELDHAAKGSRRIDR